MAHIICPVCKEKFAPKHGNQKYCSRNCYRKHVREYNRIYKQETRAIFSEEKFCSWCGKKITQSGHWKYCSDICSANANRKRVKEKYYKKKEPEGE